MSSTSKPSNGINGWKAVCGCTYESLALFRICLGVLLTVELVLRYRFLKPFYSDEGTLPLRLLLPNVDETFHAVCLHCRFGEVWEQQILLSAQVILAACFTLGVQTRWSCIASWYLYFSLTLRNTWMNYILDRYIHYLLFLSMFLPLGERLCVLKKPKTTASSIFISPGTVALKLLVTWIYVDAGLGKYLDPLGGWSYHANPLPALDTYARHTTSARYMYALLGSSGLRLLTPVVVWVELLAAPVALIGQYLGSRAIIYISVTLICSLHLGIAAMLRNAALLSFLACTPWCAFLPLGWKKIPIDPSSGPQTVYASRPGAIVSIVLIGSMVVGNLWLATLSQACDQSVKHIWSTLLHNRWNVFVGAEEYVTWEIAPGQLADGSVVDVWGRTLEVSWSMPGTGAPCTSTARPGRWRSFPYLAELEGEDAKALWGYLCKEWDQENNVDQYPGRKLIKYNFFMLQADVLPEMAFSATRKRLVHSHECVDSTDTQVVDDTDDDTVDSSKAVDQGGVHESEATGNEL